MTYSVKEIFYTLQGEGLQAGKPAVFCRFSGCNLWSGREQHRSAAVCKFCDTAFVGVTGTLGGKFHFADELAQRIESLWPSADSENRLVVLTGGEPLLQLDRPLIRALQQRNFKLAVETNGTIQAPEGLDWICVSPKAGTRIVQTRGDELKLVFPQSGLLPQSLDRENLHFDHWLIQPMDGPLLATNTAAAIAFCQNNPQWRLCLQTHKLLGIR